jgi:hypothetical protein
MSLDVDGENVEVQILGTGLAPPKVIHREAQCVMRLPLAAVKAGLHSGGTPIQSGRLSGRLSHPALSARSGKSCKSAGSSGRPSQLGSARSMKSLTEWYMDSGLHTPADTADSSRSTSALVTPRRGPIEGPLVAPSKLHSRGRNSETPCYKMTNGAPELPPN